MTTTTALPPEIDAYLAAVRAELGDLPPAERDDLLAEVEDSLLEAAAEGGPLSARLGSPEDFAAELRSAAGLQEAAPRQSSARALWPTLRDAVASAAAAPAVAAARSVLTELAPIWWVARAYVAVAAFAIWSDAEWSSLHPVVPQILGTSALGAVTIAVAALASIWIGLRSRPAAGSARRILVVANAILVFAALPVLVHLADSGPLAPSVAFVPAQPSPELTYDGARVENIYPYTRDGRLLHDVLLYDADGAPIEIGGATPDPDRRILRAAGDEAILNSFPIRYFEPGTRRVARPDAAPLVRIPRVVTPPLRSQRQSRPTPTPRRP